MSVFEQLRMFDLTPLPYGDHPPRMVSVDVRGLPRPQGSMTLHKTADGQTVSRYPPTVWEWRYQVQQAVAALNEGPFLGPVIVRLGFDLPRPAGHMGTGRNSEFIKPSSPTFPIVAPDLDKLTRCINDAITDAGLWKDDSQVVAMQAAKRYHSPPGVLITVSTV